MQPAPVLNSPASQFAHSTADALEPLPAGHAVGELAATAQEKLAGHGEHSLLVVTFAKLPAVHLTQESWPVMF